MIEFRIGTELKMEVATLGRRQLFCEMWIL